MTRASRDKGNRFERQIVATALEHDLKAVRVPLSGAAAGFKDDVIVRAPHGEPWRLEVKKRAGGFKQIYAWLATADALIIGADRQRPLAVLDLEDFFALLKEGDQ